MSQVTLEKGVVARIGSPPPKRYKIGELARHTGLTRQTLHNYTRWGLISEIGWTPGGHRLYDGDVFARLAQIIELKTSHTVKQILAILAEDKGVGSRFSPDPQVTKPQANNDSRPLYSGVKQEGGGRGR